MAAIRDINENESYLSEVRKALERGWRFVRCRDKGDTKAPMDRDWPKCPNRHPFLTQDIEAWVSQGNNVALVTGAVSGVAVIDFDVEKDDEGNPIEGIDAVLQRVAHMGLPPTVMAETGGGGLHLYFAIPEGAQIPNSVGKVADKVDVRGEGGCVVFPGSLHPKTGRVYTWWEGHSPGDVPLAPFPSHLLPKGAEFPPDNSLDWNSVVGDEQVPSDTVKRCLAYIERCPDAISGNGGHDATFRAACECYRFGLSDPEAFWVMQQFNAKKTGDERWTEEELLHKLSGARKKVEQDGEFGVKRDFGTKNKPVLEVACSHQDDSEYPQPRLIDDALPVVEEFDSKLLPDVFRPWLDDVSERMQCPIDYAACSSMVVLGAVVGRQLSIRPKRKDDWFVVPNLWGAIVGPPGVMKSPTFEEVMRPLNRLEAAQAELHKKSLMDCQAKALLRKMQKQGVNGEIKKAIKAGKEEDALELARSLVTDDADELPVWKRYKTNDTTMEKLGEILSNNPNGILVFRDELNGLLKGLEKQGREGERQFYLESWNGDASFTFDRIGRGTIHVDGACVSILGGIQPRPLAQYLQRMFRGEEDDGFLQRFQMFTYPDVPTKWRNVDRYPDTEAKNAAYECIRNLTATDVEAIGAEIREEGEIPYLRFGHEAQEGFDEWHQELEIQLRDGQLPPILVNHLAKYRSLVPSLALLLHLADGRTGPVGDESLLKACAWAEYLESHARRIYGTTRVCEAQTAGNLLKRIEKGELACPFTVRDVYYSHHWAGLNSCKEVQNILDLLESHNLLIAREEKTGGRPKTLYWLNPRTKEVL